MTSGRGDKMGGKRIVPGKVVVNVSEVNNTVLYFLHVFTDVFSVFASYLLAYLAIFREPLHLFLANTSAVTVHSEVYISNFLPYCIVLSVCFWAAFSLMGMYDGTKKLHPTPIFWNSVVVNAVGIVLVATILYYNRNVWHMRSFFTLFFLINTVMVVALKHLLRVGIHMYRRKTGKFHYYCILVGNGKAADKLQTFIDKESSVRLYKIVDRLPMPRSEADWTDLQNKIDPSRHSMILAAQENMSQEEEMRFISVCLESGMALKLLSNSFVKIRNPYSMGDYIHGIPFVNFCTYYHCTRLRVLSRAFSWITGLAGIVILSPVFLIAAAAVKLTSPGPAIFRQTRCGFDGKPFTMYKFRTMRVNAENMMEKLRKKNESDGALFKMKDDPRVTSVGAFLRKTSIDELPQFINLLQGNMVIVGPRPLPMSDIKYFDKSWQHLRHLAMPGITCIWQVAGRSRIGFDEMCLLDIWYALNRNWVLDVKIMIRTVWAVIFSRGAY